MITRAKKLIDNMFQNSASKILVQNIKDIYEACINEINADDSHSHHILYDAEFPYNHTYPITELNIPIWECIINWF